MKPFSIAALQLNLDYSNNQDLVVEKTKQAVKRYPWIQMVILSELAVGGSSRSKEFSLEKQLPTFQRIAKELKIWYLPGSFYHHVQKEITNVAPVISPKGDVVTSCTKIYPFLPYEKGIKPGLEPCTFTRRARKRWRCSRRARRSSSTTRTRTSTSAPTCPAGPSTCATRRCPSTSATTCLLYTSPSPRDKRQSRMPSSA